MTNGNGLTVAAKLLEIVTGSAAILTRRGQSRIFKQALTKLDAFRRERIAVLTFPFSVTAPETPRRRYEA
jgi:hypothetical protein